MGSQTWMGSHSLSLVHFTLSECGKWARRKQVSTRLEVGQVLEFRNRELRFIWEVGMAETSHDSTRGGLSLQI